MKLSTSFRWFPAAARAVPAGRDPHSVSTSISRRQWSLGPHSSVLLERGGAQWSEERAPEASRFRCACPSAAPLLSLRRGHRRRAVPGRYRGGGRSVRHGKHPVRNPSGARPTEGRKDPSTTERIRDLPACLTAPKVNCPEPESPRTSPDTARKSRPERRKPINILCDRNQREKPSIQKPNLAADSLRKPDCSYRTTISGDESDCAGSTAP